MPRSCKDKTVAVPILHKELKTLVEMLGLVKCTNGRVVRDHDWTWASPSISQAAPAPVRLPSLVTALIAALYVITSGARPP